MDNKIRLNTIVVIVLAILFYLFFDVTKHYQFFSANNPFAEDPYDAIGSFALQTSIFLGIVCLLLLFRSYRNKYLSEEQKLNLIRIQFTIALAVIVTLSGDIVAMIRYFSSMTGTPARDALAILVTAFLLLAITIGFFLYHSAREIAETHVSSSWSKPVTISVIFLIILFFYPDHVRETALGAYFTVIVGTILFFTTVSAWGRHMLPIVNAQYKRIVPRYLLWLVILFIGILLGFAIVLRELVEDGKIINFADNAFIILFYISLEVFGCLVGYAFLGRFLGLFYRKPN